MILCWKPCKEKKIIADELKALLEKYFNIGNSASPAKLEEYEGCNL